MAEVGVITVDGNTAAAHVAYALSETVFLFPITPATAMGEHCDAWCAQGRKNCFGQQVSVVPMQSEAGVAGSIHGAAASGALVATFTCSQGLLLMIPNMYKIAGELTPCVIHVASRQVGGQSLTIYPGHNDVMATRATGWAMLASNSVQEAADLALVAHLATVRARVPFLHFFDGFRTSHEIAKVDLPKYSQIAPLISWEHVQQLRDSGLNPTHPHVRGTIMGAEIFFTAEERSTEFYNRTPDVVEDVMRQVSEAFGRTYHCFDYYGHPQAERVIVVLCSACSVVEETIDAMRAQDADCRVGLVKVRLFRPWSVRHLLAALPATATRIAVLDRVKEFGALGEPLYLDVCASFNDTEAKPTVVGGRFGIGGKEFTPACVKAVYDNLAQARPKNHFTVGISDDVCQSSLAVGPEFSACPASTVQCLFWGVGADGTVGANHEAIKIIGDNTDMRVQGYFFYGAHKSGGTTVSHLRFGREAIRSEYLILEADYIGCHFPGYVRKFNPAKTIKAGGTFVLNCPWADDAELEAALPARIKRTLAQRKARFYTIDASKIAEKAGLGKRINTVMQAAFFRLSGVLPFERALDLLKKSVRKTYEIKGEAVVKMNIAAIDASTDALRQVAVPAAWADAADPAPAKAEAAACEEEEQVPPFVRDLVRPVAALEWEGIKVSDFAPASFSPMGLTRFEKRGMAAAVPVWNPDSCTQCNECSLFCPHAAIRPFLLTEDEARGAGVATMAGRAKASAYRFRVQVSALDCTGCAVCATACRAKALQMVPLEQVREAEAAHWRACVALPNRGEVFGLRQTTVGSQYHQPLLEFSGCCEGCGETPYVKVITQMFGERMVVANASGCSSVWGGTWGSVPYTTNARGEGPAWGNSLFEDNAEYGFGMACSHMQRRDRLRALCRAACAAEADVSEGLRALLARWADAGEESDKVAAVAREVAAAVAAEYERTRAEVLREVYNNRDQFVKISYWIVGGDGWAYDINYGGLDHVVAMGQKVNVLILDTEVYSNTGGQRSKSTNIGAIAKFAAAGNRKLKKDMGLLMMSYGDVYVASVSLHANQAQALRAIAEAESYPGTSVILAYAPCKEHGFPMSRIVEEAKAAVDSGYWPLYRYDPRKKPAMQFDSKAPTTGIRDFVMRENRYAALARRDEKLAGKLFGELEHAKAVSRERLMRLAQESTDALQRDLHQ
uniref:Pyruvate:ferredoxin oxidoreductase PFO-1 n=1 Tax=Mastigamoeba balamuthi TaxID=108607 RepID=A0A0B4R362_MASBA|nr:pyruvate:ferredoxin oxidoreductase PFO-1 [Mastigamoeba balamuthi]